MNILPTAHVRLPLKFNIMSDPAPAEMTPEFIVYSNGPMLLAQTAPIYAIAASVVIGRCYVRALIVKSFRWDDWTMALTLVSILVPDAFFSTHGWAIRCSQHCALWRS